MPENKSNGGEFLGVVVLVLALVIVAILRAIALAIEAVMTAIAFTIFGLGDFILERPWISFPLLLIAAALTYILESLSGDFWYS